MRPFFLRGYFCPKFFNPTQPGCSGNLQFQVELKLFVIKLHVQWFAMECSQLLNSFNQRQFKWICNFNVHELSRGTQDGFLCIDFLRLVDGLHPVCKKHYANVHCNDRRFMLTRSHKQWYNTWPRLRWSHLWLAMWQWEATGSYMSI